MIPTSEWGMPMKYLFASLALLFGLMLSGCANHPVDCAVGFAWGDCKPGTAGYANMQREKNATETALKDLGKQDDHLCRSWGAKAGTPEYVQCRQSLYSNAANSDAARRQAMAAIFVAKPTQPSRGPVNCTSTRSGVSVNTTCY